MSGGDDDDDELDTTFVDAVYIAPAAGERMQEVAKATLVAGRGIIGDRYCARKGTYSLFRASIKEPGKREPGRQLTLVSAEGLEQALIMAGVPALGSLGDMRRNVVVRGVPGAELQAAVGHEIALGDEVVVFAHRSCVPCMYNERKNDRKGLVEATWDAAGVCCEVVRGGTLRPGDAVRISPLAEAERVDAGRQPPGFFVAPSQRTRAMVRGAQLQRADELHTLLQLDPGGVARGITSFQSVGLTMFQRPKRFRRGEVLSEKFFEMVALFFVVLALMAALQKGREWYEDEALVHATWAEVARRAVAAAGESWRGAGRAA